MPRTPNDEATAPHWANRRIVAEMLRQFHPTDTDLSTDGLRGARR